MAQHLLHKLIQSLTSSQKRYYKVRAGSDKKQRNYLQLFDALDQMHRYDEELLRRKLKGSKILKSLSSEKNYLYEHLLMVMRGYSAKKSASIRLNGMLQDIEFLHRQSQMEACRRRIRKARREAEQFELYTISLQLIDYELSMIPTYQGDRLAEFDRIEQDYRETIRKYQQLVVLQQASRGLHTTQKGPHFESMLERFLPRIKNKGLDQNMTFYMATRLLNIQSRQAFHKRDHKEAARISGETVAAYQSRPDFMQEKAL